MGHDSRVLEVNKNAVTIAPAKSMRNNYALDHSDSGYWFLQGYDFANDGVTATAVDAYRQALRIDPANIDAMMNMAAVYEE